MPVRIAFSRTCQAYLTNGSRVKSGVPRFEPGKFAGSMAARFEDGGTNLLTANQSNVETDTTGFTTQGGASISRNTMLKFEGAASLRVSTGTGANAGVSVSITTSTQGTYAGRVRLKNSDTPDISVFVRINYSDATFDSGGAILVPPSSEFTEVIAAPVTANVAKTVTSVEIRCVRQTVTTDVVFYVDALQLERAVASTSWHIGGGTRNGEVGIVPAADLYDPSAGTIEAWIYLENNMLTTHQVLVDTRQPAEALAINNRLVFSILNNEFFLRYWQGSTTVSLNGGAVTPRMWTYLAATWSSAGGAVYWNGNLITSNGNAPVLTPCPSLGIGSRLNNTQSLNGLIGGLRLTKGRARTLAEILATYNSNAQFTEDSPAATVFTFDGTMRALLPSGQVQYAPESAFVRPTTVTASTTATNYVATNILDYEFPLLSHRTTTAAASTLTFDFGDVVALRAVFVALVNWEGFGLAMSYDDVTYTDVAGSPFACQIDGADAFRKCGAAIVGVGRYARISIAAQVPDGNVAYYETPLVIFASDLNALRANPNWGIEYSVGYNVESNDAGGHDEQLARGQRYLTAQVRGDALRTRESADWHELAALGPHQKFLLFQNFGRREEAYLMRPDGRMGWSEQASYSAFSHTWKEHIN